MLVVFMDIDSFLSNNAEDVKTPEYFVVNTCKAEFAKQYTLFSFFLKKVLLNISLLVNEGKFFPENIM